MSTQCSLSIKSLTYPFQGFNPFIHPIIKQNYLQKTGVTSDSDLNQQQKTGL